jgi:hypothetical protein
VRVLVRTDAAGATHALTARIAELGMEFSIGAYLHHFDIHAILRMIPKHAWTPAYNADGKPRDGAWVAEVTDLADLTPRPTDPAQRAPHPSAQLASPTMKAIGSPGS